MSKKYSNKMATFRKLKFFLKNQDTDDMDKAFGFLFLSCFVASMAVSSTFLGSFLYPVTSKWPEPAFYWICSFLLHGFLFCTLTLFLTTVMAFIISFTLRVLADLVYKFEQYKEYYFELDLNKRRLFTFKEWQRLNKIFYADIDAGTEALLNTEIEEESTPILEVSNIRSTQGLDFSDKYVNDELRKIAGDL